MEAPIGSTVVADAASATERREILAYYTHPKTMTTPGSRASLFDPLPHDTASLAAIVRGLLLHEHIGPSYGTAIAGTRLSEAHIRRAEQMLERIMLHEASPLSVVRPLENRLIGVCRHFAVLLTSMLRAQGVPARGRCGFATYFHAGEFIDHWACEHWHARENRWVTVDAQLDAHQRRIFNVDFDPLDVPRDRFLVAGDAWDMCRAGHAEPMKFGIMNMRGLWFVAGNLLRDFAALNNLEMLPWDVWGAMPLNDEQMDGEALALFDRIAALTRIPDESFVELRALYETDQRLRIPVTVFNARLNRQEDGRA